MRSQACLSVALAPPRAGPNINPAHVGVVTGSRDDGAAVQVRTCSPTQKYQGWEQIWRYVDYNDPADPADDIHQGELNVYAGTMCAAPKPGVADPPIPVLVFRCDGSSEARPGPPA